MLLYVGSTNPVKINAVTTAASETWPDARVVGLNVESNVPEQPIGDGVTREGARNRARAALNHGLKELDQVSAPDVLGVGLEGGVMDIDGEMFTTVWVAVVDSSHSGEIYEANGARFKVAAMVADRIKQGEEMGPIIADVVGEADIRSKQGMIGVVTEGFVDRTEEYEGVAKLALGMWYGRNWQDQL